MLTIIKKVVTISLMLLWIYGFTSKACNNKSDANYFSCSQRGNFPNYNDESCRTYYSCLKHSTGFYQNLRTCNKGTAFNRSTNKCDWYYICPCTEDTPTHPAVQKMQSNCVVDPTENFNCTIDSKSGCYGDPTDPFCGKYIFCYVAKGNVYQQERECPKGTFFNASSDVCGCSVANGLTCTCRRE